VVRDTRPAGRGFRAGPRRTERPCVRRRAGGPDCRAARMPAMARCPHCATDVPAGARYCPGCGAVQSPVSPMPAAFRPAAPPEPGPAPPGPARSVTSPIGRLESSVSFAGAAFQPGQVIAGRYRVIGLLGRGGMGEVYRADDLQLAQPVALKFLGRALADRPDMLERFRG